MPFLLDTCAVSEPLQKHPKKEVLEFLGSLVPSESFVSVFALGELWKGIELLPPSRKKTQLADWFREDFEPGFAGRVLPLDRQCMIEWAKLVAHQESRGTPVPVIDSLIAATALAYDLTVVTRNVEDFERSGASILNPWK
jgi:predicted nucleic acid-binding protein